ncbi:MAG: hypothetical protein FWF26_00830 [Treponema sp.]|nr:hypothetical protein [Treponema sp.]
MKRLVLFLLVLGLGVSLFAQVQLPEYHFASGSWTFIGDRLYQNDANARLAKVNIFAPQSGPMLYEFNVRYEGGIEDGHGGFGLHIFVNNVLNRASWGSGSSYLLWLNYDENPITKGIPKGFSAQVYRSYTNSYMELVQSIDLNEYAYLLTYDNCAANTVPVKIWADGNTGEVRVYDPTDPTMNYYFYLYLDKKDLPLKGNWVSLRTNGIQLSFGMGL